MNQRPENRVRPVFVALLGCAVAAVVIPVWMLTRSNPATAAASPGSDLDEEQLMPTQRKPRAAVPEVTAAPRGSAVSKRATTPKPVDPPLPPPTAKTLEDRWGIHMCSAQLSMGNTFVDLRYEVTDTNKAALLAGRNAQAYVVDKATGTKLFMPAPPKEGCFPPTGNRLAAGKSFFAIVGNKRHILRSGSRINVVIGDVQMSGLLVE